MNPFIWWKKWPPSIRCTIKWWSFWYSFFSKWPKNDPLWVFLFSFFDFRLWISMVEWPPLAKILDPLGKVFGKYGQIQKAKNFQILSCLSKMEIKYINRFVSVSWSRICIWFHFWLESLVKYQGKRF